MFVRTQEWDRQPENTIINNNCQINRLCVRECVLPAALQSTTVNRLHKLSADRPVCTVQTRWWRNNTVENTQRDTAAVIRENKSVSANINMWRHSVNSLICCNSNSLMELHANQGLYTVLHTSIRPMTSTCCSVHPADASHQRLNTALRKDSSLHLFWLINSSVF